MESGFAPRVSRMSSRGGWGASIAPGLIAATCLVALLINAGPAEAGSVRIMPLGDSITVGVGDGNNGGYRGPLATALGSAGYAVDFVGSQTGGVIADPNHEGHGGWRADQIRDNISYWLSLYPADIVLLHIGTNDITQSEQPAGITAEIAQILSNIDAYEAAHRATITVILARIINRSTPSDTLGVRTSALNASIASMVVARLGAGDRIVLVDQEAALAYPGDLVDVVHPNAAGYAKMSAVWFSALTPLLRNRGEWVGDTLPNMLVPGSSYACTITMRNSGHEPWLCSLGTMLTVAQSAGPLPGQLFDLPYEHAVVDPCSIEVGSECTFPLTIDVPADTPLGVYEIAWQMKNDIEWFDSNGHNAVFRKAIAVRLFPVYRGDFDDDGDVDQQDFGHLQACLSGMGVPQPGAECQDARLDVDSDVDQEDASLFQMCMGGSGVFPDPVCER